MRVSSNTTAPVQLTSVGRTYVRGRAPAGSLVRVYNASMAPFARQREPAALRHGVADAHGRFEIAVPDPHGKDWVKVGVVSSRTAPMKNAVAARLWGKDERRPELALRGLRLSAHDDGSISIHTVRKRSVISEPFAKLRFVNQRTKDAVDVRLDGSGALPQGFRLHGKRGDLFAVKITDGHHNDKLRRTWAYMAVGRTDTPAPHPDDRGAKLLRFSGPLVKDGFAKTDPVQGGLGNCAAVSLLSETSPEHLKRMVKPVGDGRYRVRFWQYDHDRGSYVPHDELVEPLLYAEGGTPLYMRAKGAVSRHRLELWPAIIEKALAQWLGSYGAADNIYPNTLFELFFANPGEHVVVGGSQAATVMPPLLQAITESRPILATTFPPSAGKRLDRAHLVADHAYALVGAREHDGEYFVSLRNPWGEYTPAHYGKDAGKNDGIFELPWAVFERYFAYVSIGPTAKAHSSNHR